MNILRPCQDYQLLDNVTNSFLSIDEWVYQELLRIAHHQQPRNCSSYETLFSVIDNVESHIGKHRMDPPTKNYKFSQDNLVVSFYNLIRYCQKETLQFHVLHHRALMDLLLTLERMNQCLEDGLGIRRIVEDCTRILFGDKVPISNVLLKSWLMISTWIQQGQKIPDNDQVAAEEWLKRGIVSFQIAKRMCGLLIQAQ